MATPPLRLHAWVPLSEVNGPGRRIVFWVQGCPLACKGCWNTATWNASQPRETISVDAAFARVMDAVPTHGITGISFSGGEPFTQAPALGELARRCHEAGLDVATFTGYTLEHLRSEAAPAGATELLRHVDLLIDGPYIYNLRATEPLRGSKNQRLIPLSLAGEEMIREINADLPAIEIVIGTDGTITTTGFPVK